MNLTRHWSCHNNYFDIFVVIVALHRFVAYNKIIFNAVVGWKRSEHSQQNLFRFLL